MWRAGAQAGSAAGRYVLHSGATLGSVTLCVLPSLRASVVHAPTTRARPPPARPPCKPPSPQALRLALLDWLCHVVVANGALVQTCLQMLAYSLLPPPGPPLPDPSPGEAWQPVAAQAAIQDEVLAATEKVGGLLEGGGWWQVGHRNRR